MPNQQPRAGEHGRCGASSKNAKEKSNSSTLMAIRDSKDGGSSSGRDSRCSSEKDSGYSDGSDWQHTDAEDQQSNRSQSRGGERAQTSQSGQSQQLGLRNSGNVPCMPAGRDHPPIYIIKDMVLKQQPGVIQKRGQFHWTSDSNFSGSPHVILLQQPSLVPATLQLHKPPSRRSNATGRKVNGSYLPILNSYPRIAPHPSKKPPDKPSNHESQNLSKRACTDPKTDDAPVTRGLPEQRHHKQPKLAVSACSLPSSSATREGLSSSNSATASTNQGSPSVSSLHTASSSCSSSSSSTFLTSRGHHRDSTSSTRHRRFLNTVEILQQSGLLDITLRTKELLRQSSATDRGIAQLRQHTELLCQVANGPNGAAAWEHLHRVMADSGNYPDLKALPSLHTPPQPDSASQPESISREDAYTSRAAETSEVSPCPLLENERAHSEQGRKLKPGDKRSDTVTFVPPDSSTG